MLRAIIWLIGVVAFTFGVFHWHLWQDLKIAGFIGAGMFWTFGGIGWVGKGIKATLDKAVKAEAQKLAESARRAQAEQAGRA